MKQVTPFISRLRREIGDKFVKTDAASCWAYGYDNSRQHNVPCAVASPGNAEDLRATLDICSQFNVPVTARGLGTATTGAAVPDAAGLVLSTQRLNRIKTIDAANRFAIVEAGVTNGQVQKASSEHGFFWAPDPTSADYSTVGGNLACNAAGPRAVKYGTCRDNTLGLKAITGDAKAIRTGVCTTKGVVGYDFTQLLIGSEGTLAIITEATLKLIPLPETIVTLRALYTSVDAAARAVTSIMSQPVVPRVCELMDEQSTGLVRTAAAVPQSAGAMLMIEVDGLRSQIADSVRALDEACDNDGRVGFSHAESAAQRESLWSARRALSPALRTLAPVKINEDVVVPVSELARLVSEVNAIGEKHGVRTACFGHAGNGNLHVNLLGTENQQEQLNLAVAQLMSLVISLNGTLSGEHGIGLAKRDFVPQEIDPITLQLMRKIKRQFDPNGILNPGKIFTLI